MSPLSPSDEPCVRVAALGDILLATETAGASAHRDAESIFAELMPTLADSDVVVGNLECTLPGDGETVSTEPRVVSTPELIRSVRSAGIGVVSLANNHIFDCMRAGFDHVRKLLSELDIRFFGAGSDLAEASAPLVMKVNGICLAFLGAADLQTGLGSVAASDCHGVARLDVDRLVDDVKRIRGDVDHVILSLHWGHERFLIPSPEQIDQAHRLVDAGASLIIGHHPHVIQGLEVYNGAPIAYSLGNCVTCDVPYSDGDRLTWNRHERTGCLLQVELTATEVRVRHQTPVYDDGRVVRVDGTGRGAKLIRQADRAIEHGVTPARFSRERRRVKVIKPILQHLKLKELMKLRPRHIRKGLSLLFSGSKAKQCRQKPFEKRR